MKRVLCLAICLAMIFASSCGEKQPNKYYNEQTIRAYEKAIEAVEALLNYDIDADEAVNRIQRYADSISDSDDLTQQIASSGLSAAAERISVLILSREIGSVGTSKNANLKSEDYEIIEEVKRSLEEALYK